MGSLKIGLVVLAVVAGGLAPALAANPPAGRLLAAQCFQCHGTNGRSEKDIIPDINGFSAKEMFQLLREFKTTTDTVMNQQAKSYTDGELRQIAGFLATLPGDRDD